MRLGNDYERRGRPGLALEQYRRAARAFSAVSRMSCSTSMSSAGAASSAAAAGGQCATMSSIRADVGSTWSSASSNQIVNAVYVASAGRGRGDGGMKAEWVEAIKV